MKEFSKDFERDFRIRSVGRLQVSNSRGGIVVRGWAMDKIRVRAHRVVRDTEAASAERLFSLMDFRYREDHGDIELSAEYGRGLDIQDRLKERANPKTTMEIVVYAPSHLKLRVWGNEGKIDIRNWNAPVDVRASRGEITLKNVNGRSLALFCPNCQIEAEEIRGGLRVMGGEGKVRLKEVTGPEIYVETFGGAQDAHKIQGEQLYVSKSGPVQGQDLKGRVEFHTQSGPVSLLGVSGFASGSSEAGPIRVEMSHWEFLDKALIESSAADISLQLPGDFSGDVELNSGKGQVKSGFSLAPLEVSRERGSVENQSQNSLSLAGKFLPEGGRSLVGRVGRGGEQLTVSSGQGAVELKAGPRSSL